MFTLESMFEVILWIALCVYILFWVLLRTNPFRVVGRFAKQVVHSRKILLHFVLLVSILMLNKIELWVEGQMDKPADFTPFIYRFEGDIVYWIQSLTQVGWLTWTLSFFYIIVFTAMIAVSIGVYTYEKQPQLFYALCYGLMINYFVAIPFYLFLPVQEVWSYLPKVQFLMLEFFPTFETHYRPLSGLDNCLPSLHTSVSVTMAMIALQSGNRLWRLMAPLFAGIIIFSIFYLGIHWVVDMATGLILGLVAATISLRVAEGSLTLRANAPLSQIGSEQPPSNL
jgi:membrane-associated phospholipid phosphatase